MSSTVFRDIGTGNDPGKPQRLFRAAVSAFCSLTRPTRREVAQLDDLGLPLFDIVSAETRRFAAAALSECDPAPPGLLRRLSDEPVAISAPLLLRSPTLKDVHLVGLIGRHGLEHARVIARRPGLNPAIGNLIRALLAHSEALGSAEEESVKRSETLTTDKAQTREMDPNTAGSGQAAEFTRSQLRTMMQPSATESSADRPLRGIAAWSRQANTFGKLRSTALTGKPALFATALADVLEITMSQARDIIAAQSHSDLLTALRALDLTGEEAFVVTAAAFAGHFTHAEAIRLFLDRFEALERETARDRVRGWKANGLASHFQNAARPISQGGDPVVRAS